jgi:LacI family transcriptional regulator
MTVSRVTNGQDNVRKETRQLVLRIIDELNYRPNPAARSLAIAQNTRVAMIYSNPSTAYLNELLVGVLSAASKTSTQLVLERWSDARPGAARRLAQSVAGVILPPPLCESEQIATELAAARIPTVAIAAGPFLSNLSSMRIDDFGAARDMTEHLIRLGHTRIGFIKGDPNQAASGQRFSGFRTALENAGLARRQEHVQQGYFTYQSGLSAAAALLSGPLPPTAIFASNDDMAAAVVSVAHRRGLDVPRDLTVVGFDDTITATTFWPELTTIRQPVAAMADAALMLVVRNIRRLRTSHALPDPIDRLFAHELVKRNSDARPGSRA